MHPYHHAVSSARKFGGTPAAYLPIHAWFDESKSHVADFRHRFLRHHSQGIFQAEKEFGVTITNSNGRQVPVRFIGEQHVLEDLGRIPTVQEWAQNIKPEAWMRKAGLNREVRDEIELTPIPAEGFQLGPHSTEPAETFSGLVIATSHMTEQDSERITNNEHLVAYEDQYGWWMYVPPAEETMQNDNLFWVNLVNHPMSAQFIDLLRWAQQLGCQYIRWDRDGPIYSQWIEYDW